MNNLADKFTEVLQKLGMEHLKEALFYNSPFGIRFAIGDENQDVYDRHGVNPEYFAGALRRATVIYNAAGEFDLLRFDFSEKNHGRVRDLSCNIAGLGLPQQRIAQIIYEGQERIKQEQMYWDLKDREFNSEKLLREIIRADLGGHSWLSSAVYFVNTKTNLIYHPYDDRGADIVAADRFTLQPFYERFNDWILEFDRSSIDKQFK